MKIWRYIHLSARRMTGFLRRISVMPKAPRHEDGATKGAISIILAIWLACLYATATYANDQALYDAPPPANAALVRVVNVGMEPVTASLNGLRLPSLVPQTVTAYHIITTPQLELSANGVVKEHPIKAEEFYTAILSSDAAATFLHDTPLTSPTKALLRFYNLSDAPSVHLYAPQHQAMIAEDIATQQAEAREVNALTLELQAKAEGEVLAAQPSLILKRRKTHSLFLFGRDGSYRLETREDAIAQ